MVTVLLIQALGLGVSEVPWSCPPDDPFTETLKEVT